jgi:glycosyltransferase involved in cell wall biosynthesis
MTADLDIQDYVRFTGFIKDIGRVYAFTDVAVLSSWSEGLPQSVLQALACAVPVVATRVGGVPEVVHDEKTGLLAEPGDHTGLARQIIRVLREPERAAEMALAGKELVRASHSVGHMLDTLEVLYTSLLSERR